MDDDNRPPICPRCGVTVVPAALSVDDKHEGDWSASNVRSWTRMSEPQARHCTQGHSGTLAQPSGLPSDQPVGTHRGTHAAGDQGNSGEVGALPQ